MPKVTLPLGSSEAHGRVGESFIFQGNTVKAYAKPVINKVAGQLEAQDKFQAVTRTIASMGAWGRAALPSMLGRGWFSLVFKECFNYWDQLAAVYAGFSSIDKTQWTLKAPYAAGALDAGLTFYVCANTIRLLGYRVRYVAIADPVQYGGGHYYADILWKKTADAVLGSGKFDDDDIAIQYLGEAPQWGVVENANAFGGSFHESQNNNQHTVRFDFIGTAFSLIYRLALSGGLVQVTLDTYTHATFSQNAVETEYQVLWRSPDLNKGLHTIILNKNGVSGSINIDGLIVHG